MLCTYRVGGKRSDGEWSNGLALRMRYLLMLVSAHPRPWTLKSHASHLKVY